jgi:AAA+ superfamily predicted ATPase
MRNSFESGNMVAFDQAVPYNGMMNNTSFNYSEYFLIKIKEYLLNMPSDNKLFFVFKILLLMNWNKTYSFLYKSVRKIYALMIKNRLPRLSYYKTFIKRVEPIISSSKLPQIVHKYINDKSLMECYKDEYRYGFIIDTDGVGFEHDNIHYYCFVEKNLSSNTHIGNYILECSSNLSYDETITRTNKMIDNFKSDDVYIYDGTCSYDKSVPIKIDRKMENIFLQEDVEKEIATFVVHYEQLKEEYKKLGILFKNNFLVYGEPGTGKSTLAKVIATELKRDIVLFNLKDIKNLKQLQSLIYKHKNAIIVFEELDCLIERIKKRNEQNKLVNSNTQKNVTMPFNKNINYIKYDDDVINSIPNMEEDDLELSDFLEILDGMRSTEDGIIFFTTNHINKIDPAFKRQGRINYLVEMKLCNKHQFKKIYESILQKKISTELHDKFIEYKYSPSNVIETMLKNIFELKQNIFTDDQLLELIDIIHNNFIMSTNIHNESSPRSNNEISVNSDIEN